MILYVVPELDKIGGIQEYARSIYSCLDKDFDITLIEWKSLDTALLRRGLLTYAPGIISSVFYPYLSVETEYRKKYSKIKDGDLIHFWHPEPAYPFTDKKYIVTCHGMEILEKNIKGFRKKIYPKIFEKAQRVHVNSNFTEGLALKIMRLEDIHKIRLISPCIDYNAIVKSEHKRSDKSGRPIIGTLTRFNRRKNVPGIIDALEILHDEYGLDFEFYLAGDGIERKKILSKLRKVKFDYRYFGEISNENKFREFYPALDIFVLPTLNLLGDVEGFGIVYLEANSYGIPVVASKIGGVPDAVHEGMSGVYADPADPVDIAEKILDLINKRDYVSENIKRWAEQFDVKKISRKFAQMYDEVL